MGTIRIGLFITLHGVQGKTLVLTPPPDNPENSLVLLVIHCLREESGFAMELSLGDKDTV